MTERLYYHDPYLREFDALVTDTGIRDGRPFVALDRTAFYPSSGGQPFDTGTLAAAADVIRVLDVVDADDGRILHIVDRIPGAERVIGRLDWSRRFDHIQQHSGQHVLSAAFDRLFGARTESFHLGADASTIDLARELPAAQIAEAEDEANRIVWEDRRVTIRFAGPEEAAALGLRKEPKREGTLRLIEVEDFDRSACGGTHVTRTGAIGIIAIAGSERFRGGSRVAFLCGGRALRGYRQLRDATAASVRILSVLPADVPSAIERVQAESKELRRQVKDLQSRVASHEADALADDAVTSGALKIVIAALPGWDANGLKTIASRIVERPGFVALLVGEPAPAPIVVARSADVEVDSAALLRAIVERHGGKGGGRPDLAQGGGVASPASEVLNTARGLMPATTTT